MVTQEEPVDESVLAIVDGSTISLEYFARQYDRTSGNSGLVTDTLEAYKDFLDRFIDFRVKVLEARELGYDQDPGILAEIDQYRIQLARPYIMERNIFEPLVREMYDRRIEAVSASHILITVAADAPAADTLIAYNSIVAVRDSVLAGADFGEMAAIHSQDPSAKGAPGAPGYQGELGYFGGGRMVEEFEDTAFNTALGEVSAPFRTQFGFHILKVSDKMAMPFDRELAHIMIRPKGNTAADAADMDQRISRVSTRLSAGEDFAEVAAELSDDQNSAQNGGSIGSLSYDAGLPFQFRDAAFSIEEVNQFVGPIATPFGQHFIQFVGESEMGSYEEEYETLKNRVNQMPRAQKAEKQYAAGVRKELGTWVDSSLVHKWAGSISADSLFRMLAQGSLDSTEAAQEFARIGDISMSVAEFATYFSSGRIPTETGTDKRLFSVVDRYFDEQAISYKVTRLEENDTEFSETMRDFRDGLILFKYMEDHIWSAASGDSTGLQNHYSANEADYQFPDRVQVVSYSSTSEDGLHRFISLVRSEGIDTANEMVAQDSTFTLRVDTTHVSESTGSIFDQVFELSEGGISEGISYNSGWIALYHSGLELTRAMTFEEARSAVISDYQILVEADILAGLRAKYGVEVFHDNLVYVQPLAEEPAKD